MRISTIHSLWSFRELRGRDTAVFLWGLMFGMRASSVRCLCSHLTSGKRYACPLDNLALTRRDGRTSLPTRGMFVTSTLVGLLL